MHCYNDIISVESLLGAWCEFKSVNQIELMFKEFQYHLMDNIFIFKSRFKSWQLSPLALSPIYYL